MHLINQVCQNYTKGVIMIKGLSLKYTEEDIQKAYKQGIENGKYGAKKEFEMYDITAVEENKEVLQKEFNKGFEKGSNYVREYIKQNESLQNQREEDIQKLSFNDGYRVGKKEGYKDGFTLAKEEITELNEQERQQIYYEGYDSGHNQWQNDYGFTIPNNTIKNLEATNYKKGLKDKAQINEAVKQNIANKAFKEGYAQAYSELHAPTTERERQLQEKAWDEGYVSAIEDYLSQSGEFVSNKGCYEFDTEGCCEHHNPNKETQEAMQEVLDRDSNEFEGIWVAKDNSGKLKVLNVDEGVCDVELVKHVSDSYLCVGDTVTISTDDLKEHWNKEGFENTTEDEQLEKELALVEKYPHYYKDIRHLNILDIYRFFDLFEVTDPCLQHSLKKMAVGGKRGSKDYEKDIKEAMDTLSRWEYMQEENKRGMDD